MKMMWVMLDDNKDNTGENEDNMGIFWLNPEHIKSIQDVAFGKIATNDESSNYTIKMIDGEVIENVKHFHISDFESRAEFHHMKNIALDNVPKNRDIHRSYKSWEKYGTEWNYEEYED